MKRVIKKYIIPHKENEFKPHLLRTAGILLTLVFVIGAFFMSNLQRVMVRTNDLIASVLPAVLADLANVDRSASQIGSLRINPVLENAARLKAEDMAVRSYFAHYSPDGKSPWYWFTLAGYNFIYAGENLAVHFDDSVAVNIAWMNSPKHRENILNGRFTEIGVATARGVYQGRETVFVVQLFGRPKATIASAQAPVLSQTASFSTKNEIVPVVTQVSSSTVLREFSTET